jgi:hypothetical protein
MRPGKYVLLAFMVLGLLSTSGAVERTRENYDELTNGKSVFINENSVHKYSYNQFFVHIQH